MGSRNQISSVSKVVVRVVETISKPAFAADQQGRLLHGNDAAVASLLASTKLGEVPTFLNEPLTTRDRFHAGVLRGQPFDLALASGISLHAAPVLALGKGEVGWVIVQEIAPRKAIESATSEPESLAPALNVALQAARMGLWEWDTSNDMCYWNPQLYDILQLPRGSGAEPHARFMSMIVAEDKGVADAAVEQLHNQGHFGPVRFRVKADNGSTRWLVSCGQLVKAEDGRKFAVGVNFDVTEEADIKHALGVAETKRLRNQSILDSVLKLIPVGLAVHVTGEEELQLVSDFGLNMIEAGEADGKQWDTWQIYHTDGKTLARKEEMALSRAAEGEVIHNEEWLIRRRDGSLLPVQCSAGPILSDQGMVIGGMVAWYDVTNFKVADAKREAALVLETQARRAAEEANQQKDLFVGMVSHELRTPLSAILGWTNVLNRSTTPRLLADGIPAIARNATALSRLVDDLLDVTRMAAGGIPLKLDSCDFSEVVEGAVQTVSASALARGIALQHKRPDHPIRVDADAFRLQQAIWNLLANAVKFSNEGGLVLVVLGETETSVSLKVIDHGRGIDARLLPDVFNRFWQAEVSTDRRGGLGLGLSIAKHIVERHGGSLTAESQGEGFGSTFTLTIPLSTNAGQ